jgi:CCR4-NOT transcription complex subunit 1
LRVLLVLLHDRPEFLCSHHFSLCNAVPMTCIQLRNLILSAFPRTMRLPDPFTPNLKVDLLPEIAQHPRILTDHTALLGPGLRADLDLFMKTRAQPPQFVSSLPARLMPGGGPIDLPMLNALVLHVGISAIAWQLAKPEDAVAQGGGGEAGGQTEAANLPAARDVFQTLAVVLGPEDRYAFLNAIANHLRYPNAHSHFFSCVLLGLFKECDELVKEQITRVLLERLIVNRPHPWGLLVTFIELIKNPRYGFWGYSFTKLTPEIVKVFESVASSCGAGGQVVG